MRYNLYVPALSTVHDVRPGSAIVGELRGHLVDAHHEGGGATNVTTLEHRIHHAASRRFYAYPTSARRAWEIDDLVDVGTVTYDETMRHWVIETVTDETSLRRWVPDEEIVIGGSPLLIVETGGRLFGQLPQAEQRRIIAMELPTPAACAESIAAMRRLGGGRRN